MSSCVLLIWTEEEEVEDLHSSSTSPVESDEMYSNSSQCEHSVQTHASHTATVWRDILGDGAQGTVQHLPNNASSCSIKS